MTGSSQLIATARARFGGDRGKLRREEAIWFYITVSPWLIGFILFTAGPFVASFILSFTQYNVVNPPRWAGLDNYLNLVADPVFWISLRVTFSYTVLSVPLGTGLALALAIWLNQKWPLIRLLRTLFYMPNLVAGVALSILWLWLLDSEFGLINLVLYEIFQVPGPRWLLSGTWVIPSFVLMSLLSTGGPMLIILAGLQSVPTELYEAAEIDGANAWRRFRNVTLPMISPIILFVLITGMIGAFQFFTPAFVMTQGGPSNQSRFYVLYLYQNALQYFHMGFASAQTWILFVVILGSTYLCLRTSERWVYYTGGDR